MIEDEVIIPLFAHDKRRICSPAQVTIGDDAHQPATVNHGQPPVAAFAHQIDGCADGIPRCHCHRVGAHDVSHHALGLHGRASSVLL